MRLQASSTRLLIPTSAGLHKKFIRKLLGIMLLDWHHDAGTCASHGSQEGLCQDGAFGCAYEERQHPSPLNQIALSRVPNASEVNDKESGKCMAWSSLGVVESDQTW